MKWTLNRSAQAENTAALYRLADVKNSDEEYKANRPSSILASERRVDRIIEVLSCEYVNPLDPVLENECLYNLSSGVAVDSELADQILSIKESGEEFYKDFVDDRLKSTSIKIHDPIKRNKVSLFKSACKKVVVQYHNKQKTIEINRNILAKLLAYTAKTRRQIDFKVALTFPLCSLPLCFAHPDGTRRSTKKSQLMEIVLSYCEEVPTTLTIPMDNVSAYMVDLMAMIRTIQGVPDTYEELARRLFQMLPVGYSRINIVTDTYQKISLKDQER